MKLSATKRAALLGNMCGQSASITIGQANNTWLGLYVSATSSTPGAVELAPNVYGVEVSGNNYERVNIHDVMSMTYISHSLNESEATEHNDRIGNTEEIKFNMALNPSDPSSSTGGDWGTVIGYGLFTNKAAGTLYAMGTFTQAITVTTKWAVHIIKGWCEFILNGESAVTASVGQ